MTQGDDKPENAPQGNTVYHRLLDEIRDGRLLPGERLRETELADRLGVSRTPIREAIRQLETDGLVAHVPRIGASIRTLDYPEVMELYEMRAVLEGTAARMATRAASDLEIDELVALNETLSQAGTGPEAARLNRLFHANLLDSAKNRYLARSVASLQKALLILGPTMLSDHARAKAADTEHRRILDALKARDEAGAEFAMRNHIEASQRLRIRSLRDRDRGHYDT